MYTTHPPPLFLIDFKRKRREGRRSRSCFCEENKCKPCSVISCFTGLGSLSVSRHKLCVLLNCCNSELI